MLHLYFLCVWQIFFGFGRSAIGNAQQINLADFGGNVQQKVAYPRLPCQYKFQHAAQAPALRVT